MELDVVAATPADVRAAVSELLAVPNYRQAATHLRDELATLPGPEYAATLLEQLAANVQPADHGYGSPIN